ncbi:MAG TPA: FecR family protein [Chitinophagaceae bacterium]|jgi:ferric-dicitrate binding protein FerR (iron transport regulator)|nr:FecR family protein [Chitinophagaceae bacterium]
MHDPRLAYLFQKQINRQATDAERQELLHRMADPANEQQVDELLAEAWEQFIPGEKPFDAARSREMLELILADAAAAQVVSLAGWRRLRPYIAAAVLLLAVAISWFVWLEKRPSASAANSGSLPPTKEGTVAGIVPGRNRAVLTLAGGQTIQLDSGMHGELARQGSVSVAALQGGSLQYQEGGSDVATGTAFLYNTLSTPRGGQYRLMLADGSQVWLNASSSIRFPAVFSGQTRQVEITGEAYFEVAHRLKAGSSDPVPFVVLIKGAGQHDAKVEVLGTHFNINAYQDEPLLRTTLLEGAVRFSRNGQSVTLRPGDQVGAPDEGRLQVVTDADVNEAIAWKNGKFSFNGEGVESVMRQVARWYDVDIRFEGEHPAQRFGGEIARTSNLEEVLQMLRSSGVHFRVEGRTIVVTR